MAVQGTASSADLKDLALQATDVSGLQTHGDFSLLQPSSEGEQANFNLALGASGWGCSALRSVTLSQDTKNKGPCLKIDKVADREVEVCHVVIIIQYRFQLLHVVP